MDASALELVIAIASAVGAAIGGGALVAKRKRDKRHSLKPPPNNTGNFVALDAQGVPMMPSIEDPTRLVSMRDSFIVMHDDFKTLSWQVTEYNRACLEREDAAIERYDSLNEQNTDIKNQLAIIRGLLVKPKDDTERTEG